MPDDRDPTPATTTPTTSAPNAGATISRAALERVLARASELQLASTDAPDVVSEARLLEIGREVGLDAAALRQAIAEERSRPLVALEEPGRLEESLGEATVAAQRPVRGTPDALLAALDQWMQRREGLQHKRRADGRWSWEPRRDAFQSLARAFAGRSDLTGADEIAAAITPIDGTRSLVRLDAGFSALRRSQRTAVIVAWVVNAVFALGWVAPAVLIGASPTGFGPAAALIPFAAAVMAALQVGIGWLSWRGLRTSYRRAIARGQLRLEQLLDALEQGEAAAPPSLLDQLRQGLVKLERSL